MTACAESFKKTGKKIILDESLVVGAQLQQLQVDRENWIINLRVSKMGGLLRALDIARSASEMGISLIIGAQVGETSLLSRAALTVAHAYPKTLLAQEGAFGTRLLEQDICSPPIMFGPGGLLNSGDWDFRKAIPVIRPEASLCPLAI